MYHLNGEILIVEVPQSKGPESVATPNVQVAAVVDGCKLTQPAN